MDDSSCDHVAAISLANTSTSTTKPPKVKKKSVANRARSRLLSIRHDVESFCRPMLQELTNQLGTSLPVVANERCGSWYAYPLMMTEETNSTMSTATAVESPTLYHSCYFKSTDGHIGTWNFSLKRLNLNIVRLVAAAQRQHNTSNACIILDASASKEMPDSFSRTIPIWAAVLNRIARRYRRELGLFQHATTYDDENDMDHWMQCTMPDMVSDEERSTILSLIDSRVQTLYDSEAIVDTHWLATTLVKPLRPCWITAPSPLQQGQTLNDIASALCELVNDTKFFTVVCLNCSDYLGRNALNQQLPFVYSPGAADDDESWARRLTPRLFWNNVDIILDHGAGSSTNDDVDDVDATTKEVVWTAEDETDKVIDYIVSQQELEVTLDSPDSRLFDAIGETGICIGSRRAGKPPECWENFDAVLNVTDVEYEALSGVFEKDGPSTDCGIQTARRDKHFYLQLPVSEGKRDKIELERWMAIGIVFVFLHAKHNRRILIHCAQGKDRSVAVAMATLAIFCDAKFPLRWNTLFSRLSLSDLYTANDKDKPYGCSGLSENLVQNMLGEHGRDRLLAWVDKARQVGNTGELGPLATKASLRVVLLLVQQDREKADPSRSTMQKLNRFFMRFELLSKMPHHSKRSEALATGGGSGYSLSSAPSDSNNLHSSHPSLFPPTDARIGMEYLSRATDLTMSSANNGNRSHSFPPRTSSSDSSSSHYSNNRHGDSMHWGKAGSMDSSEHTVAVGADATYHSQRDSYHRVPQSPPDAPTGHQQPHGEGSKVIVHERSASREIASVLLLAVAATSGKELALAAATANNSSAAATATAAASDATTSNSLSEATLQGQQPSQAEIDATAMAADSSLRSSYPLKKRKVYHDAGVNHSRGESDDDDESNHAVGGGGSGSVCHVSPMSHGSSTKSPSSSTRSPAAATATTTSSSTTPATTDDEALANGINLAPSSSRRTSRAGPAAPDEVRTAEGVTVSTEGATAASSAGVVSSAASTPSSHLPPSHVMVPHFPSALHWLLTEASSTSSNKGMGAGGHQDRGISGSGSNGGGSIMGVDHTVMQWVSHGQAFRIVRWDAFYRQVLPMYFSHLSIEGVDGRPLVTGTMDAFLWHLTAWGFDEIKDGPDMGAFAHTLFRRGHPQLCYDMRFVSQSEVGASSAMKFATSSSSSSVDSRSILRVPSLNSTSGSADSRLVEERDDDAPSEAPRGMNGSNNAHHGVAPGGAVFRGPSSRRHSFLVHSASSGWASSPSGGMRSLHQPPVFVNYRPEEMSLTPDGWQLTSTNNPTPQGPWMSNGQHLSTPPQQMSSGASTGSVSSSGSRSNGMPPYSPIRIRSARGARRLSINGNAPHASASGSTAAHSNSPGINGNAGNEAPLPPRGFPVSNRGMGRRHVAASLSSANKSSVASGSSELVMLQKPEQERVPVSVDTSTVTSSAMKSEEVKLPAVRSVVKRKLPLMSSMSLESAPTNAADP